MLLELSYQKPYTFWKHLKRSFLTGQKCITSLYQRSTQMNSTIHEKEINYCHSNGAAANAKQTNAWGKGISFSLLIINVGCHPADLHLQSNHLIQPELTGGSTLAGSEEPASKVVMEDSDEGEVDTDAVIPTIQSTAEAISALYLHDRNMKIWLLSWPHSSHLK